MHYQWGQWYRELDQTSSSFSHVLGDSLVQSQPFAMWCWRLEFSFISDRNHWLTRILKNITKSIILGQKGVYEVKEMICCILWGNTGLPRWLSGKESACQCRTCRSHGFDPWVGKIPWRRRKWQPTPVFPVFLPGTSHGQRSLVGYGSWGCEDLDVIKHVRAHTHTRGWGAYSYSFDYPQVYLFGYFFIFHSKELLCYPLLETWMHSGQI